MVAFIEYEVNGIQKDSDGLYGDGVVMVRGIQFDETTNAYEVVANSKGKLYANTNLS